MTQKTGTSYVKRTLLSIEHISPAVFYSFTISPANEHQYFNEEERVDKFRKYMKSHMLNRLKDNTFRFHIEVSPAGRLHLHGKFKFKDIASIKHFYLMDINYLMNHNQIEIDTISDMDKWESYMTKQSMYQFGYIDSNEYSSLSKPNKLYKNISEQCFQ